MKTINRKINQLVKNILVAAKKAFCLLMLLTGLSLSGCDNIEVSINGNQLTSLSVTNVVITPVFGPALSDYSATVPFSVSSISLQGSADAGATMTINGNAFNGSGTFPLNVGANVYSVVVTGRDGVRQTYTITITREPPSTNANLSNLTVSAGSLNPVFASQSFAYGVSVSGDSQSITVTPTSEDANASITVNGSAVNSGSVSGAIALNVGDNVISIVVTAEDGTTSQTYTVTVNRAMPLSNNADLSNLVLSTGSLVPVFNANTLIYTASVSSSTTSITATPTLADSNASMTVNGILTASGSASDAIALNVGDNDISIVVTAEDGTTSQTYTVTVSRAVQLSDNADLFNLTLSTGSLTPTFDSDTLTYTASVNFSTTTISATPTLSDTNASVTVNGVLTPSGSASDTISLDEGENTITLIVLAEDNTTTKTYTVTVTRQAAVIGSYAFYPNNGSNWNDYVLNDGTNQFDATDTTACVGNETGGYSACIHGGEMRAFEVPDHSVCGDLVATDSLGAFDWVCDGSTNPVRMVSTRLKSINAVTGTTDGTSTNRLLDSTATFITDGVVAGDKVINTTGTAITTVVSVDSETQLTLVANNFVTGEGYSINMDKNLSDILDFVTPGWLNNTITVTGTGVGLPFTTPPAAWWNNPVVIDNDGMIAGDAVAGSIYVITSDTTATYLIDAARVALVIRPGVTLRGVGFIISATTQNFLWVEGTIDATGANTGPYWNAVKFSVMRSVSASNTSSSRGGINLTDASNNNSLSNIFAGNNKYGVLLDVASTYNSLSNVTVTNNESSGIYINDSSNNNSLSNVTANNNDGTGIQITESAGNSLLNVTANNNNTGINIVSPSSFFLSTTVNNSLTNITANNNSISGVFLNTVLSNTLSNINTANNGSNGLYLRNSNNNALLNITSTNNGDNGIEFLGGQNNSLSNITAANTGSAGVVLNNSRNNFLSNIATTNSLSVGFNFANSSNNTTLANATAANHGITGIFLFSSNTGNNFTGLLKVGNNATDDCSGAGAGTGINNDCTPEGSSDHTLTTGVTLAASFVGKLTTNETVNVSDTNGTANYPADSAVFDWSSFENTYRSWGVDGDAFPDVGATNRGQWTTGTGRIWDWSMLIADTVIQAVLTKYLSGDAANSIEHAWIGTAADQAACTALVPGSEFIAVDDCRTTFLRNAVEISDTGGNDNGLCETDETCLYTPNIGSYQGHGTLISAGTFTAGDSTITGVTLMEHSINGY